MKNLKIGIAAILLIAIFAGAVSALIPPPPVNQSYSFNDIQVSQYTTNTTCISCHPGPKTIHHSLIPSGTPYGCADCHPSQGTWPNTIQYKERVCTNCHNGTAFWANPTVNLATQRPPSGRPHHNTTNATTRNCIACHGLSTVDNYNDPNVYRPTYDNDPQISPYADNRIYNATGFNPNNPTNPGRYWGGCISCHQNSSTTVPAIKSNHDTHHYEVLEEQVKYNWTTGTGNIKCNFCHIVDSSYPDQASSKSLVRIIALSGQGGPLNGPNASAGYPYGKILELRNSTIQFALGDPTNGTGCEQCHSVRSLHNIQPNGYQQNGAPGFGHVNNNSDCYGCHAWFDAGTDTRPAAGPIGIDINSITPGVLTTGVPTTVTITGTNFVQDPVYGDAVVSLDGVALANPTITPTQIVVEVPALSVGEHNVQVAVGGITGRMYQVTVVTPVTIASAVLSNGIVTITGTGFGTVAQQAVSIGKGDNMVFSDSVSSWTDTNIVAASSVAAAGDTITVEMPSGSATATITGGAVADSVTVTVPNGGDSWKRGTKKTITWSKAGASQATKVKIELLKGTSVNRVISSGATNSGTYSWSIPSSQAIGTDYKIRITSVSHTPSYTDSSNNVFSIVR